MATTFTPAVEPALFPLLPPVVFELPKLLFDEPEPEPEAHWLTTEDDTPGELAHSELLRTVALDLKVMSAHYFVTQGNRSLAKSCISYSLTTAPPSIFIFPILVEAAS